MKQWKLLSAIFAGAFASMGALYLAFPSAREYNQHVAEYKADKLQDLIDKAQDRVFYWEDVTRKYPNDQKARRELEKALETLKNLKERQKKAG